jgi:hypothetical protein
MQISRSDLLALARKYRLLAELRRAQHHVARDDVIGSLRQLAREFPGALRELDSLPLEDIDRKVELLEAAARAGAVEPWMQWMHAYHLTLRAALAVKRRLAGRRKVDELVMHEIISDVAAESGYRCDVEFVSSVASPPGGRVNMVVFRRLGAEFGAEPESLSRTLFPRLER